MVTDESIHDITHHVILVVQEGIDATLYHACVHKMREEGGFMKLPGWREH
jgi:hypothetical protein